MYQVWFKWCRGFQSESKNVKSEQRDRQKFNSILQSSWSKNLAEWFHSNYSIEPCPMMYNISKQSPTEYLFEWKSTTPDSVYTCTCTTTPPPPPPCCTLMPCFWFLTCTLMVPVISALPPPDSGNVTDHCDRNLPFLKKKKPKTVKSPGYNFCDLKDKLQQGNNLIYIYVYM